MKNKALPVLFIPDDSFYSLRKIFFEALGVKVCPYPVTRPQGLVLLKDPPQIALQKWIQAEADSHPLTTDTYLFIHTGLFCGRRYLGSPTTENETNKILMLLSGRRHRLYTAFAFKKPGQPLGKIKDVLTHVKVKALSDCDKASLKDMFPLYPLRGGFEQKIISVIGAPGNLHGIPACQMHTTLQGQGYL